MEFEFQNSDLWSRVAAVQLKLLTDSLPNTQELWKGNADYL